MKVARVAEPQPASALARWISILAHPFVMVGVLVGVAGARVAGVGAGWRATALVVALTVVPVAWLSYRQVRSGRWGNADASQAAERPILFATALAALALLLGWLLYRDPQSFLIRGVLGVAAMLALAAVVTPWLKLSLHMAFATLTATTLALLGSIVGMVLFALLPPLAWSRLALARHRPLELVVGTLLGAITGAALVLV